MKDYNQAKRNTAIAVIALVCVGLAMRGLPKSVPQEAKAWALVAVAAVIIGLFVFGFIRNRKRRPKLTAEQRKKFKAINGGLSTIPKPNKKHTEHPKALSSGKGRQ